MRNADLQPFETVEYRDVIALIGALGWELEEAQPSWTKGNAQVWVNPTTTTELLVPLRRDFDDYALLVADLCLSVAADEDTDAASILRRISAVRFDTIRLRVTSADADDTLALGDAVILVRESRTMLSAVAQSAVEPRPTHPPRRPPEVRDYLDRLQLAQTERGSFVLAIRSPLGVADEAEAADGPTQLDLGDVPRPEPHGLVGRTIAVSLIDTVQAARNALPFLERYDYERFDQVVHAGVSSNLYEALAELSRVGPTTVELSVGWSPKIPLDAEDSERLSQPVTLSRSRRALYATAAERLRSLTHLEPIRVAGPITDLHREPDALTAEVAIRTSVAGTMQTVWVVLSPSNYDIALTALNDRLQLACEGAVRRRRRHLLIESPTDFRVIDD